MAGIIKIDMENLVVINDSLKEEHYLNREKENINLIQKKEYKSIREFYKDSQNLKEYLKDGCEEFNENFELINYIGSGGFGVVYEGKLRSNPHKKVALKFLIDNLMKDKRKKRQFNFNDKNQESNFQKKLKNKNITSIYGCYKVKECSCIAMEYSKYGDLDYFQKKLIKKNVLSETLLCFIAKQVLNGLKYCHKAKIVHMDIKQQNILIDENLNIKLTDFSVSFSYEKFKNGTKIKLPISGTAFYMSPEVLGQKEIDVEDCNKVDIFSLGILLFFLAYGQFPFLLEFSDIKDYRIIYNKICKSSLIFPDSKSHSFLFRNFIKNLLNRNIKNRYSIQEALEDTWIKGANIINKEKEKLFDLEKFLINLITDNIRCFNDYIKSYRPDSLTTYSTNNSSNY